MNISIHEYNYFHNIWLSVIQSKCLKWNKFLEKISYHFSIKFEQTFVRSMFNPGTPPNNAPPIEANAGITEYDGKTQNSSESSNKNLRWSSWFVDTPTVGIRQTSYQKKIFNCCILKKWLELVSLLWTDEKHNSIALILLTKEDVNKSYRKVKKR